MGGSRIEREKPFSDAYPFNRQRGNESPEEAALANVETEKILMNLKPNQRMLVKLHVIDGLTFKQVAERTGKNQKAVEKAISRSLLKLKEILEEMSEKG